MLRGARHVVLFLGLGATSACSLLVSTSDLSSGADGGGPPAADAESDGAADVLDGGAPADVDASDDAAWCPSGAIFCDDFERTNVLGAWDRLLAKESGSTALAFDTPFGNALHVRLPGGAAWGQATLVRDPREEIVERLSYRSRVRITKLPSTGNVNLSEVFLYRDTGNRSSVFVLLQSAGVRLFEQDCTSSCSSRTHPRIEEFTVDEWHDVTLRLRLDTEPANIELELDGAVVHSSPSVTNIRPGTLAVAAGFNYSSETHGEAEAYLDRLVIEGR